MDGCRLHYAQGLCELHYARRRYGTPLHLPKGARWSTAGESHVESVHKGGAARLQTERDLKRS